ncbi:MAG TPA: substrate-binding domain-containing protein [Sphingomicrobium sp.]|nr:substrate-binding domain-containing protein [Sphingomicrobium sp.]
MAALWPDTSDRDHRIAEFVRFPPVLAKFRGASPNIAVQITTGNCQVLRQMVTTGLLDAAITVERLDAEPATDQAVSRPLGRTELVFVSEGLWPAPMEKRSLAEHRILLPDPDGALNRVVANWFGPTCRARTESAGSVDGVKQGVQAGNAIGVLPSYSVAEDIKAGALSKIALAVEPPDAGIELTMRSRLSTDPALDVLLELLEAEISSLAILTSSPRNS